MNANASREKKKSKYPDMFYNKSMHLSVSMETR